MSFQQVWISLFIWENALVSLRGVVEKVFSFTLPVFPSVSSLYCQCVSQHTFVRKQVPQSNLSKNVDCHVECKKLRIKYPEVNFKDWSRLEKKKLRDSSNETPVGLLPILR